MIRLYVDEDAAEHAVVQGLRDRAVDVLTAVEAGMLSASDEEQLRFAASSGRCLFSLNVRDFARLHREQISSGESHYGIVLIPRQRYSIGEQISRLKAFVSSTTETDMRDQLKYL